VDTRTPGRSIGDVARELGISVHALRLYERRDLLIAPVQRDAAGRRCYSDEDVEWLQTCVYLRGVGMSLTDIARYAELIREGAGNEEERLVLLRAYLARVEEQIVRLRGWADVVAQKVAYYLGVVDGAGGQCQLPA
jgi:DNA-binding transcriptional MerR regulator